MDLKYALSADMVAPFAGAWIEMSDVSWNPLSLYVAPFAGAWIEIIFDRIAQLNVDVAPFAGAWIEIICILDISSYVACRSLRGSVD